MEEAPHLICGQKTRVGQARVSTRGQQARGSTQQQRRGIESRDAQTPRFLKTRNATIPPRATLSGDTASCDERGDGWHGCGRINPLTTPARRRLRCRSFETCCRRRSAAGHLARAHASLQLLASLVACLSGRYLWPNVVNDGGNVAWISRRCFP